MFFLSTNKQDSIFNPTSVCLLTQLIVAVHDKFSHESSFGFLFFFLFWWQRWKIEAVIQFCWTYRPWEFGSSMDKSTSCCLFLLLFNPPESVFIFLSARHTRALSAPVDLEEIWHNCRVELLQLLTLMLILVTHFHLDMAEFFLTNWLGRGRSHFAHCHTDVLVDGQQSCDKKASSVCPARKALQEPFKCVFALRARGVISTKTHSRLFCHLSFYSQNTDLRNQKGSVHMRASLSRVQQLVCTWSNVKTDDFLFDFCS